MFHLEKENLTIIFGLIIEKRRSIKDRRIKQMWMTFHLLNRDTKNKEGYEVVSNVVFLDIKKKSTARKCRFFVDIQALCNFNTLLKHLPIKKARSFG